MIIKIREESPGDYPEITSVNNLAFGQENEGLLIAELRKRAEFVKELSMVATVGRKIAGHILFFPVVISAGTSEVETLSLGPMSVHPDFQKKGIGGALILNGMKQAKRLGYKSVIVLGHPSYYPKFGFSRAGAWRIRAPFDAPDDALMAVEIVPGSLDFGGGVIVYPEEFNNVV